MQEFNEELAEINARLAQYISQQRLQRVRRSLDVLEIESQKLPE
jgi:tRNA A37 N6-isopentenylltransferase MiaA